MSSPRKNLDLTMLNHVPLQPQWLMHLPAFQSRDPALVRAAIHLLCSAFYSERCGTIPSTPESIATAAHLSVEQAISNFDVLTAGWKVNKRSSGNTMTFEPMADMAKRFDADFGDALQSLQDRAVAALSSPDLASTELMEVQSSAVLAGATKEKIEGAIQDTRLLKTLPENAQLTPDMKKYILEKGFGESYFSDIWALFYNYHRSKRTTSASWESEFKIWLLNQLRFGSLTPQEKDVPKIYNTARSQHTPRPPMTPVSSRGKPNSSPVNFKSRQTQELEDNAMKNLNLARRVSQAAATIKKQEPQQKEQ